MTYCDILVVGAGSAGCVLASRLAQNGRRVILIEPPSGQAPTADRQRPARWLRLLGSEEDWNFPTEASSGLAGRAIDWPRGRGLGGSGRINAMIWFPPTEQDWRELSAASDGLWSVEELRTAYVQAESLVRPERPRWLSDSARQFMDAVVEREDAEPMVYRRVCRSGRRWTPQELLAESNVEVKRGTVQRLLFRSGVASGVQLQDDGVTETIESGGVVLCAGSIASPAILMRSGIGPEDILARVKQPPRVCSNQVGLGLQDHLVMPVIFRLPDRQLFRHDATTREMATWEVTGGGRLSSNIAECGGLFENGRFQIHVTPTHYLTHPKPDAAAAMTLAVNLTKPTARGRVSIHSLDPMEPPVIEPRYLEAASDLDGMIDGVRLCREIAATPPLDRWQLGESVPGPKRATDEAIGKSIRRFAQTLYHPVGTCALGPDATSVVDENFRVRGTEGLWVADASVLPAVPTGNPNAVVITLAILAAEKIRSLD